MAKRSAVLELSLEVARSALMELSIVMTRSRYVELSGAMARSSGMELSGKMATLRAFGALLQCGCCYIGQFGGATKWTCPG